MDAEGTEARPPKFNFKFNNHAASIQAFLGQAAVWVSPCPVDVGLARVVEPAWCMDGRRSPLAKRTGSMGGWPAPTSRVGQAVLLAASLLACLLLFKYLNTGIAYTPHSVFSQPQKGVTHVLVTGGAGFIGSHAALRLLSDGHRVTIVDNLSRGNLGAVHVLQRLAPAARLQFVEVDLGDLPAVERLFARNHFDAVMHFAAVAFVGESVEHPLQYYHNITANTLTVLEAVQRHGVKRLIYSSTCATYGEPDTMPITEDTPQRPINPYGLSKKMAEDMIRDFSKANPDIAFAILRYFNVIGSDPDGRLGEWPRPALRHYGRISGACFDAAMGHIPGLKVMGTNYPTRDGTCIRDYIHVTDLVDAHVAVLPQLQPGAIRTFNVGTGKGYSVREFVNACLKVTGKPIKVVEQAERRPGDYAEVFSDPGKIKRELGWQARYTDLEENLRMAWAWRKEHPNGY